MIKKYMEYVNENVDFKRNSQKFVELLDFVDSGKVKLFTKDDFDEMDQIRKLFSQKQDISDRVDNFIRKFSLPE